MKKFGQILKQTNADGAAQNTILQKTGKELFNFLNIVGGLEFSSNLDAVGTALGDWKSSVDVFGFTLTDGVALLEEQETRFKQIAEVLDATYGSNMPTTVKLFYNTIGLGIEALEQKNADAFKRIIQTLITTKSEAVEFFNLFNIVADTSKAIGEALPKAFDSLTNQSPYEDLISNLDKNVKAYKAQEALGHKLVDLDQERLARHEKLLKIFESINSDDWIFSSWRSHYHCLLKGVPPAQLKKDIIDDRRRIRKGTSYR